MTRLITGLEVHRYAPELNKLHLRNRQLLPAPGITTIKEAKARLFGRWQPGHQVTITVSHPDYVNLSRLYRGRLTNLTELPEHLTRIRQRHNVPGTRHPLPIDGNQSITVESNASSALSTSTKVSSVKQTPSPAMVMST
ncbi:MAG: hypothetical protein ACRC5D_12125 [Aeromonas allosaccharophila]